MPSVASDYVTFNRIQSKVKAATTDNLKDYWDLITMGDSCLGQAGDLEDLSARREMIRDELTRRGHAPEPGKLFS